MSQPKNSDRPLATQRLNELVQLYKRQANGDVAVLEKAQKAAELTDADEGRALLELPAEELAKLGWTKAELKVAIHAIAPRKDAPLYLQMAQERHVTRMKTLPTGGGDGDGKGVAQFILPDDPIEAEVVEDDDHDEDGPFAA